MRVISSLAKWIFRKLAPTIFSSADYLEKLQAEEKKKRIQDQLLSCGTGVKFNGEVAITHPETVALGNNIHIGNNAWFSSAGGLTIGDNTHISRNVTIYTVNHNVKGKALPYDEIQVPKPVSIGKNVWIGMNVSITPGVRVGDGAIIGMGTVVSKDVPPLAVVGSAPIHQIGTRDEAHYENLNTAQQYGGINGILLSEDEVKSFEATSLELTDIQPFFVVSTGRCGSQTIAHVLSQHPDIECKHEPVPQLIRVSSEFAHGEKDLSQLGNEFFDIYCNSRVYSRVKAYGESDHNLWNLISIITSYLPSSKFIWLIRDGRNVVSSTFARGWFSQGEQNLGNPTSENITLRWMYYRVNGHLCGDFSEREWENMSVFERNCWYWNYVNRKIANDLTSFSPEKWLMVRIEELYRKVNEIWDFLGVDTFNEYSIPTMNIAKHVLHPWDQWENEKMEVFEQYCSDGMDQWYPGWREETSGWVEWINH